MNIYLGTKLLNQIVCILWTSADLAKQVFILICISASRGWDSTLWNLFHFPCFFISCFFDCLLFYLNSSGDIFFYIIVAYICISLMTTGNEHPFMCICILLSSLSYDPCPFFIFNCIIHILEIKTMLFVFAYICIKNKFTYSVG